MNKEKKFYAHGKLMISGEYLVLNGALAFAVPLKYGQSLYLKLSENKGINWTSFVKNKPWFSVQFDENLEIIQTDNDTIAAYIKKLLKTAQMFKNDFLSEKMDYNIRADIDFNINWGFGSSSTLISNIAAWADVDLFEYFSKVSNGSGYDVACARAENPILFKTGFKGQQIEPIQFNPDFVDKIYFAYLGHKQNSAKSVENFWMNAVYSRYDIEDVSKISKSMTVAKSWEEFGELMKKHEQLLAQVLSASPVQEKYFVDFKGYIKSLGAWGGDFIMIVSKLPYQEIKNYFEAKNVDTFFKYKELVLQS